jgi:translation initiation factor 2 subunit 1
MIHVSEVANTWVRDIRQFVSQGQKTVMKVVNIDKERGHISLSLKRVKPSEKRDKTNDFKNEKKAQSLLNFVQKDLGATSQERSELEQLLKEKFGASYSAFEIAVAEGANGLIEDGIDKKWADKITEVAQKNLKKKEVELKGILEIKSFESDGVELIKSALAEAAKKADIKYISAPHYKVTVVSENYPEGEKILNSLVTGVESAMKGKGEVVFNRE